MAYRRPLICAPMGMGPLAVGSHSTSVLSASPAGAALVVLRWLLYWPSTVEPVASSAYRVASVAGVGFCAGRCRCGGAFAQVGFECDLRWCLG